MARAVEIKGGDKLDAYLREMSKKVTSAATVSVGFPEGSTESDGTSTPMVAAIQEFGAPNRGIPPRPFMRPTVANKSDEWAERLGAALVHTSYDAKASLTILGATMAVDFYDAIADLQSPALSPITVMLRGMKSKGVVVTGKTVGQAAKRVAEGKTNYGASTKPLIDTGDMQSNITSVVE